MGRRARAARPPPDAGRGGAAGPRGLHWVRRPGRCACCWRGAADQPGGRRAAGGLATALGPSRAVAGWWADGALAVDRDYWLVADHEGRLLVLVDDRAAAGWAVVGEVG